MTPKEKANELVVNFITETIRFPTLTNRQAKQCALITVNEIIENIKEWDFTNDNSEHHYWYWQQVKGEIKQL